MDFQPQYVIVNFFGTNQIQKVITFYFTLDDPILCSSTPIPTASKDSKQRRLSTDRKSSAAKCVGNKESSLEDDQESQRQKLIDSVVMKNRQGLNLVGKSTLISIGLHSVSKKEIKFNFHKKCCKSNSPKNQQL